MATKKAKAPTVEEKIGVLKESFDKRAIVVDLADGPCELCAIAQARTRAATDEAGRLVNTCTRCGSSDFIKGVNSDGTTGMKGNGFRSVKPSHYHLWIGQSSASGKESQWDELCIDCYREEYKAVYKKKPPV